MPNAVFLSNKSMNLPLNKEQQMLQLFEFIKKEKAKWRCWENMHGQESETCARCWAWNSHPQHLAHECTSGSNVICISSLQWMAVCILCWKVDAKVWFMKRLSLSRRKKAMVYLQRMSSGNDSPFIKNIPYCSEHAPKISGHQHQASSHCHIAVCNFGAHVLLSAMSGLPSALYVQCKKHSVFSEFALNQIPSLLLL